jgi:hypothetical protein
MNILIGLLCVLAVLSWGCIIERVFRDDTNYFYTADWADNDDEAEL